MGYDTNEDTLHPVTIFICVVFSIGTLLSVVVARNGGSSTSFRPGKCPDEPPSNPLCVFFASSPLPAFAVMLGLQLAAPLAVGILYGTDQDVFPTHYGKWDYRIDGKNQTTRDKAWHAMKTDKPNTFWEKALPNQAERSVEFHEEGVEVIYHGHCLSSGNLASMKAFEDGLTSLPGYTGGICQYETSGNNPVTFGASLAGTTAAPTTQNCRKMKSLLRLFDGTYEHAVNETTGLPFVDADGLRTFRPDNTFGRINTIMAAAFAATGKICKVVPGSATQCPSPALQGSDLQMLLHYTVGRDAFNVYDIVPGTTYCRSKLFAGSPLAGFNNMQDRVAEQTRHIRDRQVDQLKPYLEDRNEVGSMDMVFNSKGIEEDAYENARKLSYLWLIGSVVMAILCIAALTRSFFLSSMLIVGLIGTFLWTAILYRYLFEFEWIGYPQVLAFFVFGTVHLIHFLLLLKEWKDASWVDDLGQRLSVAYLQANKSVIFSGVLGAILFYSFCFSKINIVQATALFLGTAVIVSLLTYATFYPAVIIFWHVTFAEKAMEKEGAKERDLRLPGGAGHSISSKIFKNFLGHDTWRWFGGAAALILLAIMIIITMRQQEMDLEQPAVWRRGTNQGDFEYFTRNKFGHSESGTQTKLYIIWGLNSLDREKCSDSDPTCLGDPGYDNLFDLSSSTAQLSLMRFCRNLKNLDGGQVEDLAIQRRKTGPERAYAPEGEERPTEIKCFMDDQFTYYQNNPTATIRAAPAAASNAAAAGSGSGAGPVTTATATTATTATTAVNQTSTSTVTTTTYLPNDVRMPFDYDKMEVLMKANPALFPPTAYRSASYFPPYANAQGAQSCPNCDTYYRHYEVSAMNWLTRAGAYNDTTDLDTYVPLMGGAADATIERKNGRLNYAGDYGNFLRFVAVEVNLTLDSITGKSGSPHISQPEKAIKVFEAWDRYVASEVSAMPLPLRRAFVATPEDHTWAWVQLLDIVLVDMCQGLAIGAALYLLLLTIYTNNFGVSFVATLCLGACPIMVVGVWTFASWDLGLLEALNIVLPLAMGVEFVTHFAIWYTFAPEGDLHSRLERARWSFRQSAYGVVGGGAVCFICSLFLLASPINYIFRFGVTLLCSLLLSMVNGVFLFVILQGIIGPQCYDGTIYRPKNRKALVAPAADEPAKAPGAADGATSSPTKPAAELAPVPAPISPAPGETALKDDVSSEESEEEAPVQQVARHVTKFEPPTPPSSAGPSSSAGPGPGPGRGRGRGMGPGRGGRVPGRRGRGGRGAPRGRGGRGGPGGLPPLGKSPSPPASPAAAGPAGGPPPAATAMLEEPAAGAAPAPAAEPTAAPAAEPAAPAAEAAGAAAPAATETPV